MEKEHLRELGVNGRMILERALKSCVKVQSDPLAGCCDDADERSGSLHGR